MKVTLIDERHEQEPPVVEYNLSYAVSMVTGPFAGTYDPSATAGPFPAPYGHEGREEIGRLEGTP